MAATLYLDANGKAIFDAAGHYLGEPTASLDAILPDTSAVSGGGGKGRGGSKKKAIDPHAQFFKDAVETERLRLLKKIRAAKQAKAQTEDSELTDEELDLIVQALHDRIERQKQQKTAALWAALKSKSLH